MMKTLRNLLLRNWELKLLSLIIAFFVWLSLIPEEKTFSEKTLTIPLETHNIPADMELVEKPDPIVDVTIRAPNRIIDEISAVNVSAKLNLSRASIYQREYPLNETMISIPTGAEVVRISPAVVRLKLERTRQVSLDIAPNIIGQAKEGYGIAKIEVIPPRVLVKGPESKFGEKDKVSTSPVDISELTSSTEVEADLILPKPELRLATARAKARIRIFMEVIGPVEKPAPEKKKG
ncbi:MAG: YbbR-like domain-containing protein [Candidatus Aminicenantes bacterium]|nr:YbbR-like domain-containing protein [Candidatus Aminicenantes bacterium]